MKQICAKTCAKTWARTRPNVCQNLCRNLCRNLRPNACQNLCRNLAPKKISILWGGFDALGSRTGTPPSPPYPILGTVPAPISAHRSGTLSGWLAKAPWLVVCANSASEHTKCGNDSSVINSRMSLSDKVVMT